MMKTNIFLNLIAAGISIVWLTDGRGTPAVGATITVWGKVYTIIDPTPEPCQITPSEAQTTAGVVPYVRSDLQEYVSPLSAPRSGEVLEQITMSAARGEEESLRILVYGLRDISDFFIRYEAVATDGNPAMPSEWVEPGQLPFRYQRLSYESRSVRMTAKLIFPIQSNLRFSVPNQNTRVFHVTVKVPATASSGNYSGRLVIGSEGATPLTIPLNLCVRSFDLAVQNQQIGFTTEIIQPLTNVYAYMHQYGFNASSLAMNTIDLVQDGDGKWVVDSSGMIPLIQQYLNSGMTPPLPLEICRLSTKLSQKLGLYDQLPKDPVTDASDMICPATEAAYPQSLQVAYAYAIQALWADLTAANLDQVVALYPIDEPTANYHRMPMAKVQTRLIRQAAPSAKIYVTVHDVARTGELVRGGALDIASAVLSVLVQQNKDWKTLANMYHLTLHAYSGAPGLRSEGFMMAGNGIERLVLWPSYLGICNADDPLADLKATVSAAGYFWPSSTGYKNTLDFEMEREALDDLRYFVTAEHYIAEKEASSNPPDQQKALSAKTKLDSLKKTFANNIILTAADCKIARNILADIVSEVSANSTVPISNNGTFEVTGPGSMFTSWALAAGGTIGGDSGATFATYNTIYTNGTTVSGCNAPSKSAWLTIPFQFSSPLETASIFYNSEVNGYGNNWGGSAIYVIVDGVSTTVYAHSSPDYVTTAGMNPADVYRNYNGLAPSGGGIFCTSTDITPLIQGRQSFSVKFVSSMGWSAWLYGGGVFMASDAASPDFRLTGRVAVTLVSGDANGDGRVDVSDLGILAANYGTTAGATRAMGDFNGDHAVDVSDLGILAANYGTGVGAVVDFNADSAKVFAATDKEIGSPVCSGLGLPMIAGLALMGLMLVKMKE